MGALANTFRVAIFDEFLDSFAQLPRAQQKKVSKFMRMFRADPTASSINYESINTFIDPNMRTVRIDHAYRAVVLKPERGNVYVLLWVDHHDEAMAWAKNKRCTVHPDTGSLQVFTAEEAITETPVVVAGKRDGKGVSQAYAAEVPQMPPLLARYADVELSGLGVPAELLSRVRALRDGNELEAMASILPKDAYAALTFLADGESLETVREVLGIDAPAQVDTEDFAAALEKPSTRQSFALVTDDRELEAMLDAPLAKWRVFLHPSQRKLATASFSGPARVLGGAGTGKTVVAMHRAKYLASEVFTGEDERILFTTFTRNLALDIQANLRELCPPAVLRRIEVVHLDKWVTDFLRSQGYRYRILYWNSSSGPLAELWDKALVLGPSQFPRSFFREEWESVVQPQGCASYDEYRDAPRPGRGMRLSRQQRKVVWTVFEEYRNLLEARGLRESVDAMRDAANLLESKRMPALYRAVIVDEAQDMSTVAFQLLRRMISVEQANDLFIVGDGHQRIYRRKVVLKQAGVNIVGRSRKLYINYRTTDEIRRFAMGLLQGVDVDDLDGGADDSARYKSLVYGEPPEIRVAGSFEAEVEAIVAFVRAGAAERTCLVTRTNELLDQYEAALAGQGVATCRLKRSEAEDRDATGLRLATMHRIKGLEFDRIVIAGVNQSIVPLDKDDMRSEDAAVREAAEQMERSLFYVAATRARRQVLITSHGTASPWLAR